MKCIVCQVALTQDEIASNSKCLEPIDAEAFAAGDVVRHHWAHRDCWEQLQKLCQRMVVKHRKDRIKKARERSKK